MGMSPSHAQHVKLFESLKDEHHRRAMDDLCNAAIFCKRAHNHSKKVSVRAICQKGMH